MSMRVCLGPSGGRRCPTAEVTNTTRCPDCRRDREQARGTPAARGYGPDHVAERKRWASIVAAGYVKCWRCREYIVGAFDLGHDDQDRTRYRGPEHPACNRATSGRR